MKKNKLLTAALALGVLATAGIATVPVHAAATNPTQTPINVTIEAPVFDVALPISYDFVTAADGTTEKTTGQQIVNNCIGLIGITDVEVVMESGWELYDYASFLKDKYDLVADTNAMGLQINGNTMLVGPGGDAAKQKLMNDIAEVQAGAAEDLNAQADFPVHSSKTTETQQAAKVIYTVDWYRTLG